MPKKRILLAEDEDAVREFLLNVLQAAGYTVDAVDTAAEANRRLAAATYSLLIADWRLPDGNGIDLADTGANLGAKTIIISGFLFGLPAGAAERHDLLATPISTYDLVAAVQRKIGNPG
jgi:two-component system cell cycle response regulator CpdR